MKLGITREEIPIIANRLAGYLGGMIAGTGAGMLIATKFVPEDDQKIFHLIYYVIALSCFPVGGFITTIPGFFQRKKPRHDLIDEKHAA